MVNEKREFKPFSVIKVMGHDTTVSKHEALLSSIKGKNSNLALVSHIRIASDGNGVFDDIS